MAKPQTLAAKNPSSPNPKISNPSHPPLTPYGGHRHLTAKTLDPLTSPLASQHSPPSTTTLNRPSSQHRTPGLYLLLTAAFEDQPTA